MTGIRQRHRLERGWLEVWTHVDGRLRLSWHPDFGQEGYPGHTFGPSDPETPETYPRDGGLDELLAWGRAQFGP